MPPTPEHVPPPLCIDTSYTLDFFYFVFHLSELGNSSHLFVGLYSIAVSGADPGFFAGGGGVNDGRVLRAPLGV